MFKEDNRKDIEKNFKPNNVEENNYNSKKVNKKFTSDFQKTMNGENLKNSNNSTHLEELLDGEGITRYGEFVTSYFAWVGLNRQKSRAEELNEMTRKE